MEKLTAEHVHGWVAFSEEEAYKLYCDYACKIGFSVRKQHTSLYRGTNDIKDKDYVCSKAGKRREYKATVRPKFTKPNTRTECQAMIRFVVDRDGVWTVKKFLESHNHDLAESEDQHLLRSSREIDESSAHTLQTMTDAGIRPIDAISFISHQKGGPENLGFSKSDAYNYIQRERRARIENGDSTTLIQLFKNRQTSDNMFYWDADYDEDERLRNIFWVDGIGRLDYDCYGDVIVFDTTYRLNKYNLACAPIIGVNNHWQNILLGVAFLSHETIESFTWLFNTLLTAMGGKHPQTIFTDQDQAMARAIETTLPNTSHRLCQWHISQKAPSKIPCLNRLPNVKRRFFQCLSQCDSEEEFNEAWDALISEGNLEGNPWLQDLHRIRHKWSTAFTKDVFNLGILSTQRSESTNNVCHGMTKPTSAITECFYAVESIMSTWRRNERDEDHKNNQAEIVPVMKNSPTLKQAVKFYSQRIFSFFQEEFLEGVGGCAVQESSNPNEYTVKSLGSPVQNKVWTVKFNAADGFIQCSCRKFESMGLLCRHCIKVMTNKDVFLIPEAYLLPRWSSTAKKDYYFKKKIDEPGTSTKGVELLYRNHMCKYSYEIITRSQSNKDAREYMISEFGRISDGVNIILSGKPLNSPKKKGSRAKKRNVETPEIVVRDPAKVRPKGAPNKRLKSFWEKPKRRRGGSQSEAVGSEPTVHVNTASSIGSNVGMDSIEASQLGHNYEQGAMIDEIDKASQISPTEGQQNACF